MRNKKGFTLIELLAVIAILGIVLGIAAFTVTNVLNRSKTDVAEVDEGMIKKAAELYANENYATLKNQLKSPDGLTIPISTLVEEGYLSDTTYTGTVTIKIDSNDHMEIIIDAEKINIADKSGANPPKLASGMIPVVYDEKSGNWEVADTKNEWYNYDKQMWANAVTVSECAEKGDVNNDGIIDIKDIGEIQYRITNIPENIEIYDINDDGVINEDDSLQVAEMIVNNITRQCTSESKDRDSYIDAPAGTEIPMSAINSMWVWIPRYKYRIPSDIGTGSTSNPITEPPEIDVVFENGLETTGSTLSSCPITSTSCYYTHPAFRNGSLVYKSTAYDQGGWDEELEGIWVGKFETSGTSTTPTIKPDVISLRSQTVYNQFVTSLKFAGGTLSGSTVTFSGNSTYGLTSSTDTHMMKNTEWGAVAYLSQSKYGKMGNSNYSGTDKEIYKNNSSSYYTGRSSGVPPASGYTTYGSYSYDDKSCSSSTCTGSVTKNAGQGASTTGTIYGIYDMSGGANEYVMGNWNGTVGSSGFTTSNLPGGSSGSKYYEKYTGTSSYEITSVKSIKGDATYETMRWYFDNAYFPFANDPWSLRGGYYSFMSNAGAFSSTYSNNGTSDSNTGFRVALIP